MKLDLSLLKRRRIAVLFGGASSEREISIRSSAAVRGALRRLGLPHGAIDLSPRVAETLRRQKINLVFLTTHGTTGEDGRLQGLLDVMGIPYTGSGVRASALAMHKPTAKRLFESAGLATPRWTVFRKGEEASLAAAGLSLPLVIKPAGQGSAVGVTVARTRAGVRAGLAASWRLEDEALVEEYVSGPEITVGLLGDRVLPVVEIVPSHSFYDFHSKYAPGGSRHLIPARVSEATRRNAQEMAVAAFHLLGCRHMGRVDLLVGKNGRPTLLEVNTLPGMTDTSLLPDAARAAGVSFDSLVGTLLTLALRDS
ncbi:MAG: D-alanine--D-alanine ligase [Elusimicrobia bacterium]|jgi:D-alanine-D-alanine ligase|nr:D-alanine--D-alanine ligase [Elusimicrobiota bacterium]